tara:strand:- start:16679 stop:17278 length:600 start_codon:yes stop_codon:yes gene_type:complete
MLYIFAALIAVVILRKPSMRLFNIISSSLSGLGNLTESQKENARLITQAFELHGDGDRHKLYYIIATAWHESWLRPIKEIRANTGTTLRETQDRYWFTGYYGRGFVQLTWEDNYRRIGEIVGEDLANNPDRVLEPNIAAKIIVIGMMQGVFTGKQLSDYINDTEVDYYGARRIVNGTDRAGLIQAHAETIENSTEPHFA